MRTEIESTRILTFLDGQRILVLGGSGWLGMTAVRLLRKRRPQSLLVTSSDGRTITLEGEPIPTVRFEADLIRTFDPTVVLNFAAVTRDRIDVVGRESFVEASQRLFEQYLLASSLPSVVMSMHISSGAAIRPGSRDPRTDPYGHQKWLQECAISHEVAAGRRILIARVWSVSGDLVTRPKTYAFSDLIVQALTSGRVRVRADHEVWRRYTSVDRFLAVAMTSCWNEIGTVLDSGGERVEIRELAHIIAGLTKATVDAVPATGPVDDYCSDGIAYRDRCEHFGLAQETIFNQVAFVMDAFPEGRAT